MQTTNFPPVRPVSEAASLSVPATKMSQERLKRVWAVSAVVFGLAAGVMMVITIQEGVSIFSKPLPTSTPLLPATTLLSAVAMLKIAAIAWRASQAPSHVTKVD